MQYVESLYKGFFHQNKAAYMPGVLTLNLAKREFTLTVADATVILTGSAANEVRSHLGWMTTESVNCQVANDFEVLHVQISTENGGAAISNANRSYGLSFSASANKDEDSPVAEFLKALKAQTWEALPSTEDPRTEK